MAALGLLLMIVVVGTIVYFAGLVWLVRLVIREDENPPPEIIRPNLPNQLPRKRETTSAR